MFPIDLGSYYDIYIAYTEDSSVVMLPLSCWQSFYKPVSRIQFNSSMFTANGNGSLVFCAVQMSVQPIQALFLLVWYGKLLFLY